MERAAGFSILIVDDEASNLDVLSRILAAEYTTYIAKNGQSALKKAHSEKPDLILLDIIMPGMDGFEVLRRLKESHAVKDIPVICITGLNGVEDEEKGFFLGAVDYITKPFHNSIVAARVRTHIQIIRHIRTIERLGMIDSLTGLPNRRCFDGQLLSEWGRAVREMTPISLLLAGIDRYPRYVASRGYPQGDLLVKSVAGFIDGNLKRPSDLVARLDRENFAVILPNTSLNGAKSLAEEIRDYVEFGKIADKDGGGEHSVTISVGCVATTPFLESSLDAFLLTAERQLRIAGKAGGNRVSTEEIANF